MINKTTISMLMILLLLLTTNIYNTEDNDKKDLPYCVMNENTEIINYPCKVTPKTREYIFLPD